MPLTGQQKHFADQIDGLLERVTAIEDSLGGRWTVKDAAKRATSCPPHDWVLMARMDAGHSRSDCRKCGAQMLYRPPEPK